MRSTPTDAAKILPTQTSTPAPAATAKPSDAYLARLWRMQGTSMAGPHGDTYERNLNAATTEHRAALDEWVQRNVPWAKKTT